MNKYFGTLIAFLCYTVLVSIGSITTVQLFAYDSDDFYDKECADKMFDKYVKDAEPEYDKYLDKAQDIPTPDSESEIDNYLDSLDPLAKDYIDNLEPYANDYIENLGDCIK